jgi:hypothetical protein
VNLRPFVGVDGDGQSINRLRAARGRCESTQPTAEHNAIGIANEGQAVGRSALFMLQHDTGYSA